MISASMDQFPLYKLPPELRIRIYQFALLGHTIDNSKPAVARILRVTSGSRPPALLSTCQEIRKEGTAIYYGNYAFEINEGRPMLIPWLRSLPEEARCRIKYILWRVIQSCPMCFEVGYMEEHAEQIREEGLGKGIVLVMMLRGRAGMALGWSADPFREWERDRKANGPRPMPTDWTLGANSYVYSLP